MKNLFFTTIATLAIVLATTATSSAVDFKYSWEGDLDGWDFNPDSYGAGDVFATPVDLAGGAPPGAITDGDYALQLGRPGRLGPPSQWSSTIRGNLPDFSEPVLTNTHLSFDAFIPLTSFDAFWGELQINLEGGPDVNDTAIRTIAKTLKFNVKQSFQPNGVGTLTDGADYENPLPGDGEYFSFKTDYTIPDFDPTDGMVSEGVFSTNATWSQVTIAILGGGSMTPIYIDNFQLTTPAAPLDGDFNADGTVDAADYTVWRDNDGAADESSLNGNGDGIGGVDAADYAFWVANFGNGASNAVSVPEPTSVALLAMLGALCAAGNRRRHTI